MARSDRPCSRRAAQPSRSAPAPLYARVSDLEPPTPPRAPFGARPASEPEMRVHRPAALSPTAFRDPEVAALLRQQNQLLLDILGALNAQLAAGLRERQG